MTDFHIGRAAGVALGSIIAIVAHHYAHARAAVALGDGTPRLMGRVTLSFKPHVDTIGSVLLPAVWVLITLFGDLFPFIVWGKPLALSPHRLRNPRRDTILVSLAGPLATLILGGAAAVVAGGMTPSAASFTARQVVGGIAFVCLLATVWELLPMPGRDGGRILAQFLSPTARLKFADLEQYAVLFVIGAFLLLQGVILGIVSPLCGAFAEVPPGFNACGFLLQ